MEKRVIKSAEGNLTLTYRLNWGRRRFARHAQSFLAGPGAGSNPHGRRYCVDSKGFHGEKRVLIVIVLTVFSEYTGTGSASPCKETLYHWRSCAR